MMNVSLGWALPSAALIHVWWMMGWALVAAALTRRWTRNSWMGALVFVGLSIPGAYAPLGFWALAFQSPSVVLVVWALWQLQKPLLLKSSNRSEMSTHSMNEYEQPIPVPTELLIALTILGWLLCLETFQIWPSSWPSLFAVGFEAVSVWVVVLLTLILVWKSSLKGSNAIAAWHLQILVVLGVYVCVRLPTGNLWDALLDPFVWVAMQVVLLKRYLKHHGGAA
jgi:hypothetical protein